MYWEEKDIQKENHLRRNRQRRRRGHKARKRSKFGKIVLNLLILLFACAFVYSAYHLYNVFMVYHHNAKVRNEVREQLHEVIGSEELTYEALVPELPAGEEQPKVIDVVGSLKKINPEIVGWIHIKDTTIDYPVVQGTDNSYYLNRNVYKESTIAGAIFMDYRNVFGESRQNFILYGHRMRDDSMFGNLAKFKKEDFYKNHKNFTLILDDGYYTCDIFSVFTTTTYGFKYNQLGPFETDEEYLEFIEQAKQESMYPIEAEITPEDNIITLSTCDYDLDVNSGRLVVMAKMNKIGDIGPNAYNSEPEESAEEE